MTCHIFYVCLTLFLAPFPSGWRWINYKGKFVLLVLGHPSPRWGTVPTVPCLLNYYSFFFFLCCMNLMSNLQKSWASCLPGYLCWNCPWSFSVGACAGVGSVPFYRSFVLVFFKPCRSCCVRAPRSRCHIPLLSHLFCHRYPTRTPLGSSLGQRWPQGQLPEVLRHLPSTS